MRSRIPVTILCLIVMVLYSTHSIYAADVLNRLTHGDQYSLALGMVVSTSDTAMTFQVETVISGESLPSIISVKITGAFMERAAPNTELEPGEYAVLSLDKEAGMYTVAWGFFEVSSLDMATLKVIAGPLPPGDLVAFQWYINSGGVENNFYFIGTTAYVRHSDGTSTRLDPPIEQPANMDLDLSETGADAASEEIPESELDMPPPVNSTPVSKPQYVLLVLGGVVLIGGCVYGLFRAKRNAC